MLTFEKIRLKNYVLFKEAELDLNTDRITLITGENEDVGGKKSTNMVGKSLLTGAIGDILYDASPGLKNRTVARKDAWFRKECEAELTYTYNGVRTRLMKYSKTAKSPLKMRIEHDGEDMEFSTATAAREWINRHFPIPEELFYTTMYLNVKEPPVLMTGSPADKFNFIAKLFNLTMYDSLKAGFSKWKTDNVKTNEGLLTSLEEELVKLTEKRKKLKRKIGSDTMQDVKEDEKRLQQLKAKKSNAKKALELFAKLDRMRVPGTNGTSVKELSKQRSKLQEACGIALKQQNDWIYYQNALKEHGDIAKKAPENVEKEKETLWEKFKAMREKIHALGINLSKLKKLKKECPTCGQKIDKAKNARAIEELEEEIAALEKENEKREKKGDKLVKMVYAVESLEHAKADKPTLDLDTLKAKMKKVDEQLENHDRLEKVSKLKGRLEELGMSSVEEAREEAKSERDFAAAEERLEKRKDRIKELKTVKKKLKLLKKELARYRDLKSAGKLYDIMIQACSSQGIKRDFCEEIMIRIVKSMNANQENLKMFPAGVSFSYEMTGTGLELFYTDHSVGNITNTRRLSGAESGIFQILLALSMIGLLGASKLSNMMIMDEVNANMGEHVNDIFINGMLPMIQTQIPSTFLVTPLDSNQPGYDELRVIRKGNISRLERIV